MKRFVITLFVCLVVLLGLGTSLVRAQDDAEVQPEATAALIAVSGTYNYTPEVLATLDLEGYSFMDAVDTEEYFGDFEGTAESSYAVVIDPSGTWEAPIITEFTGTVLGEFEGTMQLVFVYERVSPSAEWFGNWWIMSGTGTLANLRGRGVAWGPGWLPDDPEAEPDVYYAGFVFFLDE